MPVIDQLSKSKLSLVGNGFNPKISQADWGFPDSTGLLDPSLSRLHYLYSMDGNPNVRIKNYNGIALGGVTVPKKPSQLDELDPMAPKLIPIGVVTQSYKSRVGQQYKQLGPTEGRY